MTHLPVTLLNGLPLVLRVVTLQQLNAPQSLLVIIHSQCYLLPAASMLVGLAWARAAVTRDGRRGGADGRFDR